MRMGHPRFGPSYSAKKTPVMTRTRVKIKRIDINGVAHATVPDFARLKKVRPQTVRDRLSAGTIPSLKFDGKTLIPIDEALEAWDLSKLANTNGQAERRKRPREKEESGEEQWNRAKEGKSQKLYHEGLLRELEYRQKCGELVEVEKVKKELSEIASILRKDLENFADRTHTELASMRDPAQVHKYLKEEIRRIMENLSNGAQ